MQRPDLVSYRKERTQVTGNLLLAALSLTDRDIEEFTDERISVVRSVHSDSLRCRASAQPARRTFFYSTLRVCIHWRW